MPSAWCIDDILTQCEIFSVLRTLVEGVWRLLHTMMSTWVPHVALVSFTQPTSAGHSDRPHPPPPHPLSTPLNDSKNQVFVLSSIYKLI